MIVRERPDAFLLFGQHEHAQIAGEFALRWREGPWPLESTVYATANHDLAWREPDRSPPYPGGFELDGGRFVPVWEDERTLRLDPNPFSEAFEIGIPYRIIGRDRRPLGSDLLELRVTC